jgi:hypothetical protein
MFYILFEKIKITKEEFEQKRALLKGGTHTSAIKLIGNDLINKKREDYKAFQRLVPELKELREKSDYENVAILQEEGWTAMQTSDSIKSILTHNYK